MTEHPTGTREEWLAARLELLEAEKELTRRGDELARQRQQLPWVKVDKDYRFETDEGSASFADLFGGRSQLLMYHFMFGPDYTAGCPVCSTIADGFNGFVTHLEHHDVAMWAVSQAPIAAIQAYKRRMGWKPRYSVVAFRRGGTKLAERVIEANGVELYTDPFGDPDDSWSWASARRCSGGSRVSAGCSPRAGGS